NLAQGTGEIVAGQMPGQRPIFLPAIRAIEKYLIEILDAFLQNCVGLSRINFVGPSQVLEVNEKVTAEDRPDQAQAHRHVDLQAAPVSRSLIQFILRQQEEPEVAQAEAIEGHRIRFMVLAE